MLVKFEELGKKPDPGMPLLQLGFRPFFLLAGVSAVLLILIWSLLFSAVGPDTVYGTVYWHGHEMVFGYVMAVVAGFLLTAVKNWTGRQTLNGIPLLALSILWLVARLLPFFPASIPYWLVATIDLLFLPALAAAILPLLLKTKNYRNLIFIGIILLLTAANIVFHFGVAGILASGQAYGLYAAVYTILLLISIMGGRVIPFFIEQGVSGDFTRKSYPAIEISASAVLLLLGILHTVGAIGIPAVIIALLAAVLHLIRLSGWYVKGIWRVPLLWVLVLAYGWIIVGLFLMALAMAGLFAISLAFHALTIGGIGLMTMGMMVRVSMGHSGRKLVAPGLLPAAFVALNLAVVVRVFLPMLMPIESYPLLVLISALIWVFAFTIFVFRMSPVYFLP
ncbi:MAG TPA: NnrS family protein [Gammaproteobacteria bacterium]|mgnify:CR=1 FL=1|nr:NnrS family protein [Gammaproteobacteria bacterium]